MSQPNLDNAAYMDPGADPGQPMPGQPMPGQPMPDQPAPGEPMPGQDPALAGAPPAPQPQPGVQKQKLNVYTVMIVTAFLAGVVSCVFLALELRNYQRDGNGEYTVWPPWAIDPEVQRQIDSP